MNKQKLKLVIVIFFLAIFTALLIIFTPYFTVKVSTASKVYEKIEDVGEFTAALVLGTSPRLANGRNNAYFYYRIDAAEELYKSGKVKFIIVSGDNGNVNYNEPEEMKKELVSRGIPSEIIFCDYAGFRTLDSVIRAKAIFGQEKIVIVSQKFHCERAVFIARRNGIDAYGYCATDVYKYYGFKTQVREVFARVKVFYDLMFGVEPKFYGEKVELNNK
jgi:SanA protein